MVTISLALLDDVTMVMSLRDNIVIMVGGIAYQRMDAGDAVMVFVAWLGEG